MRTFIIKKEYTSDIKDRLKKAKTLEEIILPFKYNNIWKKSLIDEIEITDNLKNNLIVKRKKFDSHILNRENIKLKSFLNQKIKEEIKENIFKSDYLEKLKNSKPNTFNLNYLESESIRQRGKKILVNRTIDNNQSKKKIKKEYLKDKKQLVKTFNFSETNQGISKNVNNLSISEIDQAKSCSINPINTIFSFFNLISEGLPNNESRHTIKSPTIINLETFEKKKEKILNYRDLDNDIAFKKTPDSRIGKTTLLHIESAVACNFGKEIKKSITKNRILMKNFNKIIDSLEDEDEISETDVNNNTSYVILPKSIFKVSWDIALVLITLYSIITTPLILAFEELNSDWIIKLDLIFEVIFIIDIILSFFTGYYNSDNDDLILNNKKIAMKYLKGWFIFDFLSSLPSNSIYMIIKSLALSSFENHLNRVTHFSKIARIMKLIRFLKFLKLLNTDNQIDRIYLIEELNLSSSIKRLIEFTIEFLIFSHILSCIFIFLARLDGENWIKNSCLDNDSFGDIYVASIYFIWTTIFTIGYGDILAVNLYERVFNILIMMVGVLVFSYTVSSLGNMVTTYDKITKRYLNNLNVLYDISIKYPQINEKNNEEIKKFSHSKSANNYESKETLYDKLMKFLNYEYKLNKSEKMKFIDQLPVKIRNELIFKMYKKVIDNFTFFRYSYQNGRNEAFNSKVILHMRPLKVYSNEYVLRDGETLHEMIFVKSGVLSLELSNAYFNQPILTLRKNDHYGVISVLNGERSDINLRIKSKFAELYIIKRNDLLQISVEHPEIFNEILQNSSKFYSNLMDLIRFKKDKIDHERLIIEEKNSLKYEKNKFTKDKNKIINDSPNNLSMVEEDLTLKRSPESKINILQKNESKTVYSKNEDLVFQFSKTPFSYDKSKNLEESEIKDIDIKKKMSLVEGFSNDSNEKIKGNIIINKKHNDQDKPFDKDQEILINTYDKQPLTRDESFMKEAKKDKRKSFMVQLSPQKISRNQGMKIMSELLNPSLNKTQKILKNNIMSPKLQFKDNVIKLKKDSSIQNSSSFNNYDQLAKLPPRYKAFSSGCKNAFIESIRKDIQTKVNEKIKFEQNPQRFLLNNLKGLIHKHIEIEKEGLKKVNDKLDELYSYIKTVDININKTK